MESEASNAAGAASGKPSPVVPGAKDSTILLMDASLTLLGLAKAEGLQALATLPQLLGLNLYRLPALLLTWISFGALVASSVYAVTASAVVAAGSVFLLQLGLTLLLEYQSRRLHARMQFRETRAGLAMLQATLTERCGHDAD